MGFMIKAENDWCRHKSSCPGFKPAHTLTYNPQTRTDAVKTIPRVYFAIVQVIITKIIHHPFASVFCLLMHSTTVSMNAICMILKMFVLLLSTSLRERKEACLLTVVLAHICFSISHVCLK